MASRKRSHNQMPDPPKTSSHLPWADEVYQRLCRHSRPLPARVTKQLESNIYSNYCIRSHRPFISSNRTKDSKWPVPLSTLDLSDRLHRQVRTIYRDSQIDCSKQTIFPFHLGYTIRSSQAQAISSISGRVAFSNSSQLLKYHQ